MALHWQGPLVESALHSVEDLAQVEQILEPSEVIRRGAVVKGDEILETVPLPIGPSGRNERAAAVRQAYEHEQNTAAANAADRC